MTDLQRMGLSLIGFASTIVASGVLLGRLGAFWRRRGHGD